MLCVFQALSRAFSAHSWRKFDTGGVHSKMLFLYVLPRVLSSLSGWKGNHSQSYMSKVWHRRVHIAIFVSVCLVRSGWVGVAPFLVIHAGSLTSDVYIVIFFDVYTTVRYVRCICLRGIASVQMAAEHRVWWLLLLTH